MAGAVEKLKEVMIENGNIFVPDQFENYDNSMSHYLSTGPEIWKNMNGHVDIFVLGLGSGGTLMGTGTYLKEKNPEIMIVAVEMTRRLASKQGFLVGISSGANVCAALEMRHLFGTDKNIATIFPDGAERYFSTALFAGRHRKLAVAI